MRNPFEGLEVPRDIADIGRVAAGVAITAVGIPLSLALAVAFKAKNEFDKAFPGKLETNPIRQILPEVVKIEQ